MAIGFDLLTEPLTVKVVLFQGNYGHDRSVSTETQFFCVHFACRNKLLLHADEHFGSRLSPVASVFASAC